LNDYLVGIKLFSIYANLNYYGRQIIIEKAVLIILVLSMDLEIQEL